MALPTALNPPGILYDEMERIAESFTLFSPGRDMDEISSASENKNLSNVEELTFGT